MWLKEFYKDHFEGPNGILRLLTIAVPMIISHASSTVMIFCDRYFLAQLGYEHMSAAMIGGISQFFVISFWFGVNGYVNAIVAQHYGAKKEGHCSLAVTQGFILSLLSCPIILACVPLMNQIFVWSRPDPEQLLLQKEYFFLLILASPIILFRTVLGSFFSGIGRPKVVMYANVAGMLLNVPLSYVMVFGKGFIPSLGIAGAAYGTLAGEFFILFLLAKEYLKFWESFKIRDSFRYESNMFFKLIRFGFPAGAEVFVSMAAFNLVMQQFHSYGKDVAAATSIVFNWDVLAFLPMIGLGIATTSMVGQNLGAKQVQGAEQAVRSSVKVASVYAIFCTLCFCFCAEFMLKMFVPKGEEVHHVRAIELGLVMMQSVALYIAADAMRLVYAGALQGAGDTLWAMWVKMVLFTLFAIWVIVMIRVLDCSPLTSWFVFILLPSTLFLSVWLRYRGGRWKRFCIV